MSFTSSLVEVRSEDYDNDFVPTGRPFVAADGIGKSGLGAGFVACHIQNGYMKNVLDFIPLYIMTSCVISLLVKFNFYD
jgi:hypothetical protein